MKILQLCHKPPVPPKDGGCIAMNNMTQMLLNNGHQVKVVAISTHKHPANIQEFPQNYCENTHFETVFINTKINLWKVVKNFLVYDSYYVNRFYSKELEEKIIEILSIESFDIIQLESIFVAPYIPVIRRYSEAKIVLRTHNIEHEIWQRRTRQQPFLLKKILYQSLTNKLKRFEHAALQAVDAYMTISMEDYIYFHKNFPLKRGTTIPFGIDFNDYKTQDYISTDKPQLFHLGSLDWHPNLEGIEWFLDEVWENIHAKFPILTFKIAGRNIPTAIYDKKIPNVIIVGEVENVNDFINSHDIMVVPLLSGSGIRVKIIEGMALGKTIITTTIGAEGLGVIHGKHLFIADTPDQFTKAIEQCLNTPDICKIIGENARNFVLLNHNNLLIINKLEDFYNDILEM